MPDYAKDLNEAQYEAVTCTEDAVLVAAGAGSGKTRTIIYRLAWLMEQNVSPESILLLTFTRKAAQEMLARAEKLLDQPVDGLTGGTFHAFAYGILRKYAPEWLNGRTFTLLDPADIGSIIRSLKDKLKLGKGDTSFPKSQTIADTISKSRNKELGIAETLQKDSYHLLPHADAIEQIAQEYKNYKREKGLLDYDDLLFELEETLKTNPWAAKDLRRKFRYILVDEYQDTNLIQARLIHLLSGQGSGEDDFAKVMAVGDEAQSIYAFRGANVRNMLDFKKTFPVTRLIALEENYRSTQPILNVANNILAHSEESLKKNLHTKKTGGDPVRIIAPVSDATQAELVTQRIEELLERYEPNEIAVLFRSGYHAYQLENSLRKAGIGFKKYGGLRFIEAAHIKDIFAFGRLALNPFDFPAFSRMAAMHKGIGPKTGEKLYNLLTRNDMEGLARACKKFPDLLADLRFIDNLRINPPRPQELFIEIVSHYHPYLERLYPEDWPSRLPGLDEIIQMAANYDSLDLFLADMSLEANTSGGEAEENLITLSTIHSAKGLEWQAVLIIDLVEDRFPSRHAIARLEDYEEERRLFYVACTRAKSSLDLFAPATIFNKALQSKVSANQSPFLREMPQEYAERYAERFGEGLEQITEIPKRAPMAPPSFSEKKVSKYIDSSAAYCRHRIFGRGKIIKKIDDDKLQVNFPGYGLKVILSSYLMLEE